MRAALGFKSMNSAYATIMASSDTMIRKRR
jgi:hypothetical protein